MSAGDWRSVRLGTIVRCEQRGWVWLSDPRRPGGRALRSRDGTIYLVRMLPLALRRYEDRRLLAHAA
jgi:hypothetical protein